MVIGNHSVAVVSVLRGVSGEVVENAEQIAIQVRRGELVQLPWLRLRSCEDSCSGCVPDPVQLIYLVLAIKIEPDHDWRNVAMMLAEVTIRKEHSALPF